MNAVISDCNQYRYSLTRRWGTGRSVAFIGLNPSTADHTVDDPTIRRCINFAKLWGYDALEMINLFSYRATIPADMKNALDAIGPENDIYLLRAADQNEVLVACWGVHGVHNKRDRLVRDLFQDYELFHLGLTKDGHPRHPLYLKRDTQLVRWS